MIRRNSGWIVGVLCTLAAASGCGGTNGDDLFPPKQHPSTFTGFGAENAAHVYFGLTNRVTVEGRPTVATFSLSAGSRVELELATRDSTPLVFEIHRVRRDGTTELLNPVHASSGFHLSTIEASSDGTYVLFFPAADHRDVSAIVHLDCKESAQRCAPSRQPGESCTAVFTCDEGLRCSAQGHGPSPYLGEGICFLPMDDPNIP